MNYKEIIKRIKPEMERTYGYLEKEIQKIRAGRISPSLVEDILVECFGKKLPLKQLGAISCPGPRQIVIQPWDKSYLEPIEKALSNNLSINASPIIDKDVIRLNLPSLTEESRKTLIRLLSEKQEEVRKTIRRWREEAWKEIQEKERAGEIPEDDKYRAKDELQDLIDEYNEKIEKIGEIKKKELIE